MGAVGGEEPTQWDTQGSSAQEEKIFVSVRLRPLNEKEIVRNDVSDWECINNTTIIFKNSLPERSMFLTGYTFDRVFGCDCSTKQVYEEGAKEVALSVVSGINSSIFAYGQTSSGKTYTMSGITEYAVADIYDYIERCKDREFVLKFSAMEIYNEAVRDLLSSDSTPLRLLDDPERGIVVEKLTEETLRDGSHLRDFLSICHAQRQTGETSLNETSSRSHQILRLTIESSAREFLRAENSSTLSATVNFVDLAGSERASQTLSAGARLKEGCHINRSLLTLGTVIRKLSKGRNGHIPYRDSKLTRILQTSLGGNARTAIICTMSPARSHVEQSRNTLLFASCAKEVATNSQVNVVMSDKALLKHLQRELARLENELRSSVSTSVTCDSAALLKEKEILIEKMDKEIKELIQQRDLAQSHVEDLLRSVGEDQILRLLANSDKLLEPQVQNAWIDEYSASESSDVADPRRLDVDLRTFYTPQYSNRHNGLNSNKEYLQLPEKSEDHFMHDGTSPRLSISTPKFVEPNPCQGWEEITQRTDADSEDICKEVRCIEMEESSMNRKIKGDTFSPGPEEKEGKLAKTVSEIVYEISSPPKGESHIPTDYSYGAFSPGPEEKEGKLAKTVSENVYEISSPQKGESHIPTDYTYGAISPGPEEKEGKLAMTVSENVDEISSPHKGESHNPTDYTYGALNQKIMDMQKSINCLVSFYTVEQSPCSPESGMSSSRSLKLTRSRSCRAVLTSIPSPPWFEKTEQDENTPPNGFEKVFQPKLSELKYGDDIGKLSRKDSQTSVSSASMDEKAQNIKTSSEGDITSAHNVVAGVNEMAKFKSEKQFGDDLVLERQPKTDELGINVKEDGLGVMQGALQSPANWPLEFERQRREIVGLWDACNVPLVHRTYFFLLFKGDPSDSVYMEVELRRLSFLKDAFSRGTQTLKDEQTLTQASSMRVLNREREMLSKQVQKRWSEKEREGIYEKWGIGLGTKQRRLQLVRRLWTDTKDMDHIKESAALVAKLVGAVEPAQAPKEMFGLTFSPRHVTRRSHSWKHSMSSIL